MKKIVFLFYLIFLLSQLSFSQNYVLVHGWMNNGGVFQNTGVKQLIQTQFGYTNIFQPSLIGSETAEVQSLNLRNYLNQYNINSGVAISYSMGGVTTRTYLKRQYDNSLPQRISQHYTIGSPHFGSKVANNRPEAIKTLIIGAYSVVAPIGWIEDDPYQGLGFYYQSGRYEQYWVTAALLWGGSLLSDAIVSGLLDSPGFNDLKTNSQAISNINQQTNYENSVIKVGIAATEQDPILFRMLAHSEPISISENLMLSYLNLIEYTKLVRIAWALYYYYDDPTIYNLIWLYRNISAYVVFKNIDSRWNNYVVESSQSDGLVSKFSQQYPNANRFYYPTNASHMEQLNNDQVITSLNDALVFYGNGPLKTPIISNFTQSPNPLYKGLNGSVTCNLSQGNGNLNFNWSIVSGNTGFSISNVNSQTVSIHYSNTDAIEKTNSENISSPKDLCIEAPTGAVLKCKAWNSAGNDSANVFINLATTPHGCPFVYTWNGETWVEDNNILPQSQDSSILGQDVTDYYQLYAKPILDDGKYYLAIGEFEEEISYLDQLKLLVVDHPQETFITVDDNGEIIQFAKPAYFANAQLDSIDVYKKLVGLDSIKAEVSRDETLSLSFEDVSVGTEKWLLLIGQQEPIYKDKIEGSILRRDGFAIDSGKENTTEFSSFRLRKNPTYQWVLVPDGNSSSLQVDIAFKSEAEIDYTELSHKLELPFTVYTPQLLYAEHSVFGDVTNLLNQIDVQYSLLNTDEMITLEYSAPPMQEGMERTFIFVSRGRYERLENRMLAKAKSQVENKNQNLSSTEKTNIVYEYGLSQNYPNPFNPVTTISYQIKEQGLVQLKVYNSLGQEIVTLVNEIQSSGIYETLFDASNLSSGVYIYSLRVNDFVQNNKMTLLK